MRFSLTLRLLRGLVMLARRAARFPLSVVGVVVAIAILVTVAIPAAARVFVAAGRRFLFGAAIHREQAWPTLLGSLRSRQFSPCGAD